MAFPSVSTHVASSDAAVSAPEVSAPAPAFSASAWRASLRQEAADSARTTHLLEAASALAHSASAEAACAGVLSAALRLLGEQHGAIVARRGERFLVMAGAGSALPPGASLIEDPMLADTRRRPAWLMPPMPHDVQAVRVPVVSLGHSLGALVIALRARADTQDDDLRALSVMAALLPALIAPAPPRTARRKRAAHDDRIATLTPRERQVLALLPRGLTNAALATELGISPSTAKLHVEHVLGKLGVRDRTQAAVLAVQAGMAA